MKAFGRAVLLWTILFSTGQASDYPNKPIRFVMGFAAGGSGDYVARAIGAKLDQAWGQAVIIDNRPGAAGTLGAAYVAKAAPDGYTLLVSDESPLYVAPLIQKSRQFDPKKDFVAISLLTQVEFVLTAHPSVAANDLKGLIELIKQHPKKYTYASAGPGSIHHLSIEWLKQLANIEILHVPYKGSAQILPDVLSGQVQLTYIGISQALPHINGGRLKAIALGGPKRLPGAPGIAPIAETFPGFNGTVSWSLFAPAGTPREIRNKLSKEVDRILKMPDVSEQLTSRGLFPLGGSPEDLASYLDVVGPRWEKLVTQLNIAQ